MSFVRSVFFERKKISRKRNHRYRKFQKSKRGIYIATDTKGNIIAESDSYEEYLEQLKPKRKKK